MSTARKLSQVPGSISKGRIKALHAIARDMDWDHQEYESVLAAFAGVKSCKSLSDHEAALFIAKYGRPRQTRIHGSGKGRAAGFLTPDQAQELSRLTDKLFSGNVFRLGGMIKKIMGRPIMPQSLRKYEASKVITVLQKMEKSK